MVDSLKNTFSATQRLEKISQKKGISRELLLAYIKAYNFLREKISDEKCFPCLSDSEILNVWLSERNWLMIPPKGALNREDAKNSLYPNIWIYFTDDLKKMACGLHWAQTRSVDNFLGLLDSLNYKYMQELEKVFTSFKRDYEIVAERKSKEKGMAPAAPADFDDVKTWSLKDFSLGIAKEIVRTMETIRKEGKNEREEGEVEWCVPTLHIQYNEFSSDDFETLLDIIKDYIKILEVCYHTLSESQVKKIRKNLEKDFDYAKLRKTFDYLKLQLNIGRINEEDFVKKVEELNNKISQYNAAFNKNLQLFSN